MVHFKIRTVFLYHFITAVMMSGISLFISIISHPLLELVNTDFDSYQHQYFTRYLLLVGSLMLIEIVSGIRLLVRIGDYELHSLIRAEMVLLVASFIVTLVFETPSHFLLLEGFAIGSFQTIVAVNWFRVLIYGTRMYFLIKMIEFFYREP